MLLVACEANGPSSATPPPTLPATEYAPIATTTSTLPPSTITTKPATPSFEAGIGLVDATRLGHSWHQGCPVSPTELRLLTLTHWGFDGKSHKGELIVHSDHARAVLAVFESMFESGYPIESITPIGDLEPDAESEPGYSNTSGFNCRVVAGTSRWSEHAGGLAIDLNPHLNPYISGGRLEPVGSDRYVDRTLDEQGMIKDGDAVVTAFEAIGWTWGGTWTSLKDYHHFSSSGR